MKTSRFFLLILILIALVSVLSGVNCRSSTPVTTTSLSSIPEIKYFLIDKYSNLFWCDPDLYPIARPGIEQQNAIDQFDTIKANKTEFTAILKHLSLPAKNHYTDQEKLLIYQQYKTLTLGLEVTGTSSPYTFTLRTGESPGYRIIGSITSSGVIKVLSQETSFNSCPICLSRGTFIFTPLGQVPVENLKPGMIIWTVDKTGIRIAVPVLQVSRTSVPKSFAMVRVQLEDGRIITASVGHPSSVGIDLGNYVVGDLLDGSKITKIETVSYNVGFTYDVLPSGDTGFYWANGILLKSTLMR
jgi:hypothetical protein